MFLRNPFVYKEVWNILKVVVNVVQSSVYSFFFWFAFNLYSFQFDIEMIEFDTTSLVILSTSKPYPVKYAHCVPYWSSATALHFHLEQWYKSEILCFPPEMLIGTCQHHSTSFPAESFPPQLLHGWVHVITALRVLKCNLVWTQLPASHKKSR